MRIAIVNDLAMALEALRRAVVSMPEAEIAWMAKDGAEACGKCQADRPDVILMDMIMPVMDGVEATRQIMQRCSCPILVVTATVDGNAERVYEALGHGALDAVNTPVLGLRGELSGAEPLIRKIRTISKLNQCASPAIHLPPRTPDTTARPAAATSAPLIAIGSSTGGPQALQKVLSSLRESIPCSVVVIQHLDAHFVPGLADWLTKETGMNVCVAEPADQVEVGKVYVACTSDHLVLNGHGRLAYVRQPEKAIHRPSVDVFFESLLCAPIRPGVAVLLTGMGRDGALGMQALQQAGWETIAQDQETSVVWGMPGAAVRLGAAKQVLPVDQIGNAVRAWVGKTIPTSGH